MAKRMIVVPEKYALEVGAPTPITTERQHEEYPWVLDKLAGKDNPASEEEKYAEVVITLSVRRRASFHSRRFPGGSPASLEGG